MEYVKIVVAEDGVDREYETISYKHTTDGNWAVDTGDGFEQFASFDVDPTESESAFDTQSRTVAQLINKEYNLSYGGDPSELTL